MPGEIPEEMKARIKACRHDHTRGAANGYAFCEDCGALLPDEDPDLAAKFPSNDVVAIETDEDGEATNEWSDA